MKTNTYRLKRYKAVYITLVVLTFPIRCPLILVFKLGELLSKITEIPIDYIDEILYKIITYTIKKFKFEEVADKKFGKVKKAK